VDKLTKLLKLQEELDYRIIKEKDLKWDSRPARLNDLCTALSNEVEELRDETCWKWWSDEEADWNNYHNARKELIDLLHFLLSAANLLDLSAEDIVDLYEDKNKINHERQDRSY